MVVAMATKSVLQRHQKQVKFDIDKKYSVLETIGEGAYGVVCSAVDNTSGQRVAIKKICGVFDIPAIAKRTLRELKILKHFKHDNIIAIKEILKPPADISKFHDVYVVLDLMGSDLHHIIHSKQELSIEHVRYFLYQLLRGLKYIHSANIIHRDLKPSNLLVNQDCELKIGDFGMARSLMSSASEQKRVMTEYVATRWYRAPELMLSVHQFTKGIDVWSAGCIFAEMLGRRPLFPGSNYLNQLQLILTVVGLPSLEFMATITSERVRSYISRLPHKNPVVLSTLFPDAPPDAIDLLNKMLQLDPRKRCTVEDALSHKFVEKYHDLDDEPTCQPFKYEIESLPLDREVLKKEILQDILGYHSKRAKPNLAPVSTKFIAPVSFPIPSIEPPAVENGDESTDKGVVKVDRKSRKRKSRSSSQAGAETVQQAANDSKKKCDDIKPAVAPVQGTGLSDKDKKLLERWQNMQKTTKPFIHPIRNHMNELRQLKTESVTIVKQPDTEIVPPPTTKASVSPGSTLQFTNFVPKEKGGCVSLVKEQTVRLPPQTVSLPQATVKSESVVTCIASVTTAAAAATVPPIAIATTVAGKPTYLIPVGSIPMYQIQGPMNAKGPIVIIPSLAPKVNAPIPIIPKPPSMTSVALSSVKQVSSSANKGISPASISNNVFGDAASQEAFQKNVQNIMNEINAKSAKVAPSTVTQITFSNSSPSMPAQGGTSLQRHMSVFRPETYIHTVTPIVTSVPAKPSSTKFISKKTNAPIAISTSKGPKKPSYVHRSPKVHQILFTSAKSSQISPANPPYIDMKLEPKKDKTNLQTIAPATSKPDSSVSSLSFSSASSKAPSRRSSADEKSLVFSDFSAGSHLSELNLNSADLSSEISVDEENDVINKLKELDERDKEIVNIIEELESGTDSAQSSQSSLQGNKSMKRKLAASSSVPPGLQYIGQKSGGVNAPLPADAIVKGDFNQVLCEVQSELTNKLSDVKSKLLNTIKARAAKTHNVSISNPPPVRTFVNNVVSSVPLVPSINQSLMQTLSTLPTPVSVIHSLATKDRPIGNISHLVMPQVIVSTADLPAKGPYVVVPTKPETNVIESLDLTRNMKTDKDVMLAPLTRSNSMPQLFEQVESTACISVPTIVYSGGSSDSHMSIEESLPLDDHDIIKNQSIPGFSDSLRESTSSLSSLLDLPSAQNLRMERESFSSLLGLPLTPKSGAAGYGLGMDFEDLFAGSGIDLLNPVRSAAVAAPDHAPLSASLLSDWLGVNDLDPAEIDDLQRELESTSSTLLLDA